MPAVPDLLIPARDRLNSARYDLRAADPDGAWEYVGEAARLLDQAITELGPVVPPPDPPPARTLGPGANAAFATSTGQSVWVSTPNLPASQVGLPVVLTWAGTGFQGAALGAVPASVRQTFVNAGAIYVECAYRHGTCDAQKTDALAAFDLVASECLRWGGAPARLYLLGHSSGGWLAAWVALDRQLQWATLMSGAALLVQGYQWPLQSQQLLASAQVTDAKSPGRHIGEAAETMHILAVIADQDEQIPPASEVAFAQAATAAGHTVDVTHVPGLHGASIDPGIRLTVQHLQSIGWLRE